MDHKKVSDEIDDIRDLITDKTFLEMKVKAKRKNGTPIRLFPGSAKYPVEDRFRQLSEGRQKIK